ncbi:MAG: 3-oxoacyl-(Acyl-carrier-protein) reductase [Candidatus Woesebacteria bacterium GW2011_GWA2_40_7]|uniref:3-oxoacyl-(Acyl-carrier-protein) reductase n=3 Tax=Candidatus Woeseibacteriota TaxID=1752722 RepID=A0A0G0UVD4_9BACT|nr:MAG: 3-oxoacyl-(Acyl-carrier-protein) reductase [Candidatus Woesebacteria bacterium GW2011_GWB1_39_10]KKR74253.1 MAG: 3-oxoacyl-(Acyl-carrier-protein) reductase [Candidatus Woesebacteria bacterium GW2011_GWA2_40_7]KKR92628.1 MAG: 3-oxoacyl-(Acyl-carrier-protein) reductase [Candidatus Woesebacteria bacterium GW2011_GWA1_41_13b]
MDLKDKVAVVTGGSSGMGQAISISLAKEGCKVIFTYNSNEKGAAETLKEIGKDGLKFKVDLHKEEEMAALFGFIKDKHGKLDILVNNAGINRPRGLFEPNDWKEIFQVDLFSIVYITGKAVELMGTKGKILNITSVYGEGKACFKGIAPYGAAKAALNHYTQMLAKNLAPGILVNAVAPGYVQTPLWGKKTDKEFEDSGKEQLIERMIMPEEIAEMVIAVIKSDAMTGEIVLVDGGISLKTV